MSVKMIKNFFLLIYTVSKECNLPNGVFVGGVETYLIHVDISSIILIPFSLIQTSSFLALVLAMWSNMISISTLSLIKWNMQGVSRLAASRSDVVLGSLSCG